jgi:hypothetical protein
VNYCQYVCVCVCVFFFWVQSAKKVFCGSFSFQITNVQLKKIHWIPYEVLVGSENDRKMLNFCHFNFLFIFEYSQIWLNPLIDFRVSKSLLGYYYISLAM